jgi:hypothetical protein
VLSRISGTLSRISARIVTGPAAFFVAWIVDLVAFLSALLARRIGSRRGGARRARRRS